MSHIEPFVLFAGRDLSWSRSLRAALRRRGAQVLSAEKLSELLDLSARLRPDLVVLDSDLSPFDSAFVVQLVRQRTGESSIALITDDEIRPLHDKRHALGLIYAGPHPADPERVGPSVLSWLGAHAASREAPGLDAPMILCVDDDPAHLASLERLIRRRGYRAAAFDDPAAALEALHDAAPDLAIVDVMMPGMDGLELTREIRALYGERLPVVLLTARTSDGDIVEGYREGADFYLTKPCAAAQMLNVIDFLVGDLDDRERKVLQEEL